MYAIRTCMKTRECYTFLTLFTLSVVGCTKPSEGTSPVARVTTSATAVTPAQASATVAPTTSAVSTKPGVSAMRVLDKSAIPTTVNVPGTLHKALAWTDSNGENLVVFAKREILKQSAGGEDSGYLDVQHVLLGPTPKVLRHVKDQTEGCDADLMVNFRDAALELTDLDKNDIGELTFAYSMSCTSDVSPARLKLLTIENGHKYILRGETVSLAAVPGTNAVANGGTYVADFGKAPPVFLEHAKASWEKVRAHSEVEAKLLPKLNGKGTSQQPCELITLSDDGSGELLDYKDLKGRLSSHTGYDYKDREHQYLLLTLDRPFCLDGKSMSQIQVNVPEDAFDDMKKAFALNGKRAIVSGGLRRAETTYEHRPIVMLGIPKAL